MYTIKAWWAGHLLKQIDANTLKEVEQKVSYLKHELSLGQLQLTSCGVTMTLGKTKGSGDSLCIDIYEDGRWLKPVNIKCDSK